MPQALRLFLRPALLALLLLLPLAGRAQGVNPAALIGSWHTVSINEQGIGEAGQREITAPFGLGRAIFSAHHVVFVNVESNRPSGTDEAAMVAQFRTMSMITGTWRLDGSSLIISVDGAWSEALRGVEQVRQFRLDGDRLIIISPEYTRRSGGRAVRNVVMQREP